MGPVRCWRVQDLPAAIVCDGRRAPARASAPASGRHAHGARPPATEVREAHDDEDADGSYRGAQAHAQNDAEGSYQGARGGASCACRRGLVCARRYPWTRGAAISCHERQPDGGGDEMNSSSRGLARRGRPAEAAVADNHGACCRWRRRRRRGSRSSCATGSCRTSTRSCTMHDGGTTTA